MKRSAPRRVLKSVVGPALGTTLAALLAIVPTGCDDPRPTVTPDPTPAQSDSTKTKAGVTEPDPNPIASESVSAPPTIPDPGKTLPPVGKPIPKVGKSIPVPGKKAIPMPGPAAKDPFPKAGAPLDDDEHAELRPTRARRRVTDPTYQAMSGSGPRRLA